MTTPILTPNTTRRTHARFGWIPDLPDHRDLTFTPQMTRLQVPQLVDLRPKCPPIVDQGHLGSCTANAIAGAHEFEQMRQGKMMYVPDGKDTHDHSRYVFAPSRLFIYYCERDIEGTTDSDSGAMIRDGLKVVATSGVCTSRTWPYRIGQFTVKPPPEAYVEAKARGLVMQYRRVDNTSLTDMLSCLAEGTPFVFGFTVCKSFESDEVNRTGYVPFPRPHEAVLGGHAVVAVGYDINRERFIWRNSYGPSWGQQGYGEIDFQYLTSMLVGDCWAITAVE